MNQIQESYQGNEQRAPQTLKKKKSSAGVRNTSQPMRHTIQYPTQQEEFKAPRRGTLRNAIRRLLGRGSRESEPTAVAQISPPRHGHHRSEPTGLPSPRADELERPRDQRISQRNFSIPLDLTPISVARTRSPYAVEFPQSSRLKPLNLGNPFDAPGSQLRRRKTLPSVLVSADDAAAIKASIDSSIEPPALTRNQELLPSQIGRAISTRGSDKRRSRSETDLRGGPPERPKVPQRKRSDEIRYWRESYQPNVLRASGFRVSTIHTGAASESEDEKTPMPRPVDVDPFDTRGGSQGELNVGTVDINSFSAMGTELSRDLEDRVARLENGLRDFQASLGRLNAERKQRASLTTNTPCQPGSGPRRARASSGGRSASFLARDLQGDLEPSSYEYDYRDTLKPRPATSPQQPQTPVAVSGNPALTVPMPAMDDPFVSPAMPPPMPAANDNGNSSQMPQHTFRSLYEMLNDERSARRRLEQTMRNLQDELANLHYQVSVSSNVQSQRNSYMPSSTRLQALLAGTEESPPQTSDSQHHRFSGGEGLSIDPRVVSRFSGSESEHVHVDEEGMETPYELYQTPAEERFRYEEREGGMF